MKLTVQIGKDEVTGQIIAYNPQLEVSGYGETKDKAVEMMKFNMIEELKHSEIDDWDLLYIQSVGGNILTPTQPK